MDVKHVITREKKILDDLNESFLSFSITELDTAEDVGEGLLSINEHGRDYRHIHVELKEHLGEAVHFLTLSRRSETIRKRRDSKSKP